MRSSNKVVFLLLMLSGEVVFLLPFVMVRLFRPSFLEVFQITNFDLGASFSVYGIVAFFSYFFGGPIADRFPSKYLLAISLLTTSIAGFVMASIPTLFTLTLLYGFWGLSSILLFWAAFIKATRYYGGDKQLGISYGVVDAGRGLTAALLASVAVYYFDFRINGNDMVAMDESEALSSVITAFSIFTFLIGILLWILLPKEKGAIERHNRNWGEWRELASNKLLWLQSLIVLCAYVGYKTTDDFSLYANEVLGFGSVESARVGTISFWMRPLAAIIAGWLGDKYLTSRMVSISFVLIIIGSLLLSSGISIGYHFAFGLILIASTSAAIYGLRALYFALFKQNTISIFKTGTAVGLISVIGYSPDIFFGPLMGAVLDNNPGPLGHQLLFLVLAGFALIGLLTSVALEKNYKSSIK